MKRIAFAVVTVVLGACAGAFCTWAFFFLMNAGLDLLWVKAPAWLAAIGMPAVVYPLAFCRLPVALPSDSFPKRTWGRTPMI